MRAMKGDRGAIGWIGAAVLVWSAPFPVVAQVIPDTTLPSDSVVNVDGATFVIDGGTAANGNLFHSFEEFSVPTGGAALFNNAVGIENIFSRVTGSSISEIDGVLGANGTANLFFLNPNGIVFGPNARLELGGSFVASTADSVVFDNGFEFSASNPQVESLLAVDMPMGLQFRDNPGDIVVRGEGTNFPPTVEGETPEQTIDLIIQSQTEFLNNSVGLRVETGETLALVGGHIDLDGGILKTPSGRIELGSVGSGEEVAIESLNRGWQLDYTGVASFRDLSLSQEAGVTASGEGGGEIRIRGGSVTLSGNTLIVADTLGTGDGSGIDLTVGQLSVREGSRITAGTVREGNAGDVSILASTVEVLDGAQLSTFTLGRGDGGTVTVEATDTILFSGTNLDGFSSSSGAFSRVEPGGEGNAGGLSIVANSVEVLNGAQLSSSTNGMGDGGTVRVEATDTILFSGTNPDGFPSGAFSRVNSGGGRECGWSQHRC